MARIFEICGKAFPGLGVSNCCAQAAAYVPGYPPAAADIVQLFRENNTR